MKYLLILLIPFSVIAAEPVKKESELKQAIRKSLHKKLDKIIDKAFTEINGNEINDLEKLFKGVK